MRLAALLLMGVMVGAGALAAGEGSLISWPLQLAYQPAGVEHRALGPSCGQPDGHGVWLYDLPGHAFVHLAPGGVAGERVPAPGFAHSLAVRADGSLAYVDLARGVVTEVRRDGVVLREVALPPGLTRVRRILEVDGALNLHTAFQETFRVPDQGDASVRQWFAGKREGLLFVTDRPAAQVLRRGGRVELRLVTPAATTSGASVGGWSVARLPVKVTGEVKGADLVGPARDGGWWLRLTLLEGGKPRDALVGVGPGGDVRSQAWLPQHGTLSWPDTLFVQPDGSVTGLVPSDDGVSVYVWGLK